MAPRLGIWPLARLSGRRGHLQIPRRALSTVDGSKPLENILVANRGEIALRVGRSAAEQGIRITTVYTDPDANSQHALSSPFNVNLGGATAYLDGEKIIRVAKDEGCDSIHPGYGFLSENSAFAKKCLEAGLTFIGPPWEAIEAMGNKSRSKDIMTAAGVPCIPGYHGSNQDPSFLQEEAEKIGFPILLKAVKGGGGKGMRISRSATDFQDQLASAKSEAMNSFGDDTMLVEKYIIVPRHIEVQVFADKHGNCVALGERDCSIQRRHQKILEESPAPNLDNDIRHDLWEKARAAALAVKYEGAGTVEFIFDNETGDFFFMEMNTRLQVEHPVTEMVTGLDLVKWQIAVAQGERLPMTQEDVEVEISKRGHAIEARIYAENPEMNFVPDSGRLLHLRTPPTSEDVRIDAGFVEGDDISSHYDPMIAKLIVRAKDRHTALTKLKVALESYEIAGPITNVEFLKRICTSADFVAGAVETGYIEKHTEDLFPNTSLRPEFWASTALGLMLQEVASAKSHNLLPPPGTNLGFGSGYQPRTFHLAEIAPGKDATEQMTIGIRQIAPELYNVQVGETEYTSIAAKLTSPTTLQAFFPHARISSTVVRSLENETISTFQRGRHHRFTHVVPSWIGKALGIKDVANSVMAPMPCKILRVDVNEGDEVKKDQSLLVIESMKMETVIRAPQNGIVKKVVHQKGDICKAGTALVEFAVLDDG